MYICDMYVSKEALEMQVDRCRLDKSGADKQNIVPSHSALRNLARTPWFYAGWPDNLREVTDHGHTHNSDDRGRGPRNPRADPRSGSAARRPGEWGRQCTSGMGRGGFVSRSASASRSRRADASGRRSSSARSGASCRRPPRSGASSGGEFVGTTLRYG